MKTTRRTGIVFPRDYGTTIQTNGTPLFVSPSRYALSALHLLDPAATTTLLEAYAGKHDAELPELYDAWKTGLKTRFGVTPRELFEKRGVHNVALRGQKFVGNVWSKRDKKAHAVQLGITGDAYRCDCPDDYWNDTKRVDALCGHAATLAFALARDKRSQRGSAENYTGLTGSDLQHAPHLPFRLNRETLAELIVSYVLGVDNHCKLSQSALGSESLYSPHLKQKIATGTAQFMVLPQRPKKVLRHNLGPAEDRFLGACEVLEARIGAQLQDAGYGYEGRSLVFVDSPFEGVAKRFRSGETVYELVRGEEEAPILVEKRLGKFSSHWLASGDNHPLHPLSRGAYMSLDDATRREAHVRVLRPGSDFPVFVPQVLAPHYRT